MSDRRIYFPSTVSMGGIGPLTENLRQWSGEPIVVIFFLALERPIALKDSLRIWKTRTREPVEWVRWNGGNNFVGLRFHRPLEHLIVNIEKDINAFRLAGRIVFDGHDPKDNQPNDPATIMAELPEKFLRSTVVEAATPLLPSRTGGAEPAVNDALDRCLEELQLFMDAYATVTDDIGFRPITRQTCRVIAPVTTQDLDENYGELGSIVIHEGAGTPYVPDDLNDEQLAKLNIMWRTLVVGGPFDQFVRRSRVAWREFRIDGDYSTVVIAAYTACEVLLNSLLLLMVWEEGATRASTQPWFESGRGFIWRISSHLPPRLGGNWNTQKQQNPMSRLILLSKTRNRVVHTGYAPTEEQARMALAVMGELEAFVKRRLATKRMKYPRSCLLLLGRPGLERLHSWDQPIRNWFEEHADSEPAWIDSFREWRDSADVEDAED